jgi:hypothetical protein
VTRRHRTPAGVIEVAERAALRNRGVDHASSALAEPASVSDATSQPSIPHDPVLAFSSVDERFIDFLVEEALNEWRAKNF